jgi:hypothetical protein
MYPMGAWAWPLASDNMCRVNFYQEGDHVHPYLNAYTAFQRALTTWASWVDLYINPQRTRMFFWSSSPSHFRFGHQPFNLTWAISEFAASSSMQHVEGAVVFSVRPRLGRVYFPLSNQNAACWCNVYNWFQWRRVEFRRTLQKEHASPQWQPCVANAFYKRHAGASLEANEDSCHNPEYYQSIWAKKRRSPIYL